MFRCDFGGPVHASLVALSGELVTGGGANEVDLRGTLAVDRLRCGVCSGMPNPVPVRVGKS